MTKSLLSAVRRLHFNTGHPPNYELERVVRLAGGSDLAQKACRGIRCTVCRKTAPPKSAKPGKVKNNIGQFNETVMGDLMYIRDANGVNHGFLVLVDEGTDWCVVKYIGHGANIKTADQLYDYVEDCWINWAGRRRTYLSQTTSEASMPSDL